MQTIELILIGILICLQIYVFRDVCKKNHLISTILPKEDSVEIRREIIGGKPIKVVNEEHDGKKYDLPNNSPRVLFFNTINTLEEGKACYFKEENATKNEVGLIKLEISDRGSIRFSPICKVKRMKMFSTWKTYHQIFISNSPSKYNDEDYVKCMERGECTPVPGGWKVIKKATIEY